MIHQKRKIKKAQEVKAYGEMKSVHFLSNFIAYAISSTTGGFHPSVRTDFTKKRGNLSSRQIPSLFMVAGAGFEPTTSGL